MSMLHYDGHLIRCWVAGCAIASLAAIAAPQWARGQDETRDRGEERTREDQPRDRLGTEELFEQDGREGEGQAETRLAPRPGWPVRDEIVLGVYADPLDAGYRINGVVARSPAAMAGLEVGDVILAVDGFQVGRVGSDFFPLGRELQLRARGDLRVILLVRNVRNGRVLNLETNFRTGRPRGPRFRDRDGFGDRFDDRVEALDNRFEAFERRQNREGDDGREGDDDRSRRSRAEEDPRGRGADRADAPESDPSSDDVRGERRGQMH